MTTKSTPASSKEAFDRLTNLYAFCLTTIMTGQVKDEAEAMMAELKETLTSDEIQSAKTEAKARCYSTYEVCADRTTGEWIGKPELLKGCLVMKSYWNEIADTEDTHFDTFEVDGVTCAIIVHFTDGEVVRDGIKANVRDALSKRIDLLVTDDLGGIDPVEIFNMFNNKDDDCRINLLDGLTVLDVVDVFNSIAEQKNRSSCNK